MGALYDQVEKWLSDAPQAAHLIRALETLPLLGWTAREPAQASLPMLCQWGHVVEVTRAIPGADVMLAAMAEQIVATGSPKSKVWSELSGAAVSVSLGAIAAGRIPENESRSADWVMVWPEDCEVDVEVTSPLEKEFHRARRRIASELVDELMDATRGFDLVIHLVDPTNSMVLDEVRSAIQRLTEGEVCESVGRWQVRAEGIDRDPSTLFVAGQDQKPQWWPADHVRAFCVKSLVAGPTTIKATAQTRVCVGMPFHRYINPVQHKAERPQGRSGLPFLIAIDIKDLPGGLNAIPSAVEGYLPLWRTVSGILLFQEFQSFEHIGWIARLIKNPHAVSALPPSIGGGVDLDNVFEIRRPIREVRIPSPRPTAHE